MDCYRNSGSAVFAQEKSAKTNVVSELKPEKSLDKTESINVKLANLKLRKEALGVNVMDVNLEISDPYKVISLKAMTGLTKRALERLNRQGNHSLSLAVVADEEMASLNKRYRSQDKSTDVLSFPFLAKGADKKFPENTNDQDLGEVVIAHGVADRQAKEKNHSLQEELRVLYIHGLLHLLGYDHESDSEQIEMEELEQEILNS